jgi:hypothetical protein
MCSIGVHYLSQVLPEATLQVSLHSLIGFLVSSNNVNGKLRTDHGAHFTADALAAVRHSDDMVAPAVSLIGLVKDVLRAKLHAEAAPLAPLLHHVDLVLAGFSLTTAQKLTRKVYARDSGCYGNLKIRISYVRGCYQI